MYQSPPSVSSPLSYMPFHSWAKIELNAQRTTFAYPPIYISSLGRFIVWLSSLSLQVEFYTRNVNDPPSNVHFNQLLTQSLQFQYLLTPPLPQN